MAYQDNTPMESIQLDFSDNLSDDFGIEGTQVLASKDLNTFLLSDPSKVKSRAEEEAKKKAEAEKAALEAEEEEKKKKDPKAKQPEKVDPNKAFADFLSGTEETEETETKEPVETEQQIEETEQVETPSVTDDDNPYTTLGKDLMRLGVFSRNSEEETEDNLNISSPEDFLERFNLEKKKGAVNILENFLSQYGDEYRKMFDAVFAKGVDPKEYLEGFVKLEALSNIDISTEQNQERVVREYYRGFKWDEEKITNKINRMKDYGELEDEAKSYHEILKAKESETLSSKEAAKEEQKKTKQVLDAQTATSYNKILQESVKKGSLLGFPINAEKAKKVFQYVNDKPYQLEGTGEKLSTMEKELLELNRPENHEKKLLLGFILESGLDLSIIKKAAVSEESKELFNFTKKNNKNQPKQIQTKSFF